MSKKLSILFLCRKYYYLHKMSRVRFHAIRAIGKLCDVVWSGPEWENWDAGLSAADNIELLYSEEPKPDMVLCYKTDEIPGLASIKQPAAVNRDELCTEDNTAEEAVRKFTQHKIDLVISHQKNQLDHPLIKSLPCDFAYIPYCADTAIFKDYGAEKKIDALLAGHLAPSRYPLRAKLYRFFLTMQKDPRLSSYKFLVYPHPGYRLEHAEDDKHVINFAKAMNASKICVTCSGTYRLKYAKYVEAPACRTLLMADMPCEDQDILKDYLAEISPDISYEAFVQQLLFYLRNEKERKRLAEAGYSIIRNAYTQEHYARRFVNSVQDYLTVHDRRKIWIGLETA